MSNFNKISFEANSKFKNISKVVETNIKKIKLIFIGIKKFKNKIKKVKKKIENIKFKYILSLEILELKKSQLNKLFYFLNNKDIEIK